MATYRYVAYSVLESIKESKDDSDLKRNEIIFWTQVISNRLIQQRLSKRHVQSGEYLVRVTGIPIVASGVSKYAVMPSAIIDLENDNGIHQVTYHLDDYDYCDSPMEVPFEKTEPGKIWSLLSIPIRKPTPTSPKMAREGINLYLYGIEQISVSDIDMWLFTAINPVHLVDLDDTIPIAEDQVEVLINKVLGMARLSMVLPNDLTNTGSDNNSELNQKIKNVIAQVPQNTGNQPQQQQDYE